MEGGREQVLKEALEMAEVIACEFELSLQSCSITKRGILIISFCGMTSQISHSNPRYQSHPELLAGSNSSRRN